MPSRILSKIPISPGLENGKNKSRRSTCMKDDVLMYNSNELNAAYAADGYARFRRGLGVLATTYVHHSFASWFHLRRRL